MAYGFHRTKITYQLGWLTAALAFFYKLLNITWSEKLSQITHVRPLNFLEASVVLFLVSIASAQYASTYLGHEFPRFRSEQHGVIEEEEDSA